LAKKSKAIRSKVLETKEDWGSKRFVLYEIEEEEMLDLLRMVFVIEGRKKAIECQFYLLNVLNCGSVSTIESTIKLGIDLEMEDVLRDCERFVEETSKTMDSDSLLELVSSFS
jgi:hypothetical protein